jgi:capsule polysaccharide export protein KpsE/RkpR
VDPTYNSLALVNPPKDDGDMAKGAIQDIASGLGGGLGSLLGSEETGLDDCVNILESSRFARQVIKRFDLETVYEYKRPGKKPKKYYFADVIKTFRENARFDVSDEGAITISMKDTSAVRAREMVSYMIFLLDSLYTDVQRIAIRQRLEYVDQRLSIAEKDMRRLEDSLILFQNRHNLLIPEAQVRLVLQNAAETELRVESIKEELALEAAMRGTTSGRYRDLVLQKKLLEQTLQNQLRNRAHSNTLIPPTRSLPALAAEYFRLERAFTIRMGVFKFLVQQAEMLKLDADKSIQVISVIDPPWVNDKKVAPKRRIAVQATFILSFLFSVFIVILWAAWERHIREHPLSAQTMTEIKHSLRKF